MNDGADHALLCAVRAFESRLNQTDLVFNYF
jgi:hypothetical protein